MLAHTFIHGGMKKSLLSHLAKEHFLRHPVFETKSIFNFNKKCKNRAWQKIDKIDWVRHSLFDSLNSVFTINWNAFYSVKCLTNSAHPWIQLFSIILNKFQYCFAILWNWNIEQQTIKLQIANYISHNHWSRESKIIDSWVKALNPIDRAFKSFKNEKFLKTGSNMSKDEN